MKIGGFLNWKSAKRSERKFSKNKENRATTSLNGFLRELKEEKKINEKEKKREKSSDPITI